MVSINLVKVQAFLVIYLWLGNSNPVVISGVQWFQTVKRFGCIHNMIKMLQLHRVIEYFLAWHCYLRLGFAGVTVYFNAACSHGYWSVDHSQLFSCIHRVQQNKDAHILCPFNESRIELRSSDLKTLLAVNTHLLTSHNSSGDKLLCFPGNQNLSLEDQKRWSRLIGIWERGWSTENPFSCACCFEGTLLY